MTPDAPRKRLKVTIDLDAHDWDHVDAILTQIQREFAMGQARGGSVSGGGWIITVSDDPSAPGPEEFKRQLAAWCEALR